MALDKTIPLKEGRTLAYAIRRPARTARLLLPLHTRFASLLPFPRSYPEAGVRLIIPDRPGSGLSDFQPCGASWIARDVTALADSLGIGRFAVAGHSSGGSYVAACAYKYPQRITAAAILSGIGPVDTPMPPAA